MSKYLTDAAIQAFDARIKLYYDKGSMLRPHVQLRTGVTGDTYRFQRAGKGMATKVVPQTDVVPMNLGYNTTTAILEAWNAPEYTSIFDAQTVNFSEREVLSSVIGNALGRREDQLIIDALDAAGTTYVVPHGGVGLTTDKCRETKRLMDKRGVPGADRKALIGADSQSQLLGDAKTQSADYNVVRTLVDGEIKKWLGFEFMWMEDRAEGGLPVSGTTQTNFFYHPTAVGLAVGIDRKTYVDWIATKVSWLANGVMKMGATHIDPDGIVETQATIS